MPEQLPRFAGCCPAKELIEVPFGAMESLSCTTAVADVKILGALPIVTAVECRSLPTPHGHCYLELAITKVPP